MPVSRFWKSVFVFLFFLQSSVPLIEFFVYGSLYCKLHINNENLFCTRNSREKRHQIHLNFFHSFYIPFLFLLKTLIIFFGENKKVRQRELAHRKTQTPIVAKQISSNMRIFHRTHSLSGICIFTKSLIWICTPKKGIIHLFKKR